jgi:hypothetical protein
VVTLDSDDLAHLLSEVISGTAPGASTLPDTAEVRAKRDRYGKEVAAIRAKGLVPDVSMEWPDILP